MLGRCEIEAVVYRPCRLPLSWASVLMLVFMFGTIPDSYSGEATRGASQGKVTYLGNEALLIQSGEVKLLFDPFFHRDYGYYQLVPDQMRTDIFEGKAPFNNINAIFVSHAHGDHFSADDMMMYLQRWPNVHLYAPAQAVRSLRMQAGFESVVARVTGVSLEFGDPVWRLRQGKLEIDAVRIPHSGWPARAKVENIVFRVKVDKEIMVTHLGDADANVDHYLRYRDHWHEEPTDVAFPPYWFKGNPTGHKILHEYMNAKRAIGIHVPRKVPPQLKSSGEEFFSRPGEEAEI